MKRSQSRAGYNQAVCRLRVQAHAWNEPFPALNTIFRQRRCLQMQTCNDERVTIITPLLSLTISTVLEPVKARFGHLVRIQQTTLERFIDAPRAFRERDK